MIEANSIMSALIFAVSIIASLVGTLYISIKMAEDTKDSQLVFQLKSGMIGGLLFALYYTCFTLLYIAVSYSAKYVMHNVYPYILIWKG